MIATLDNWNSERSRQNEPPLAIGIGLNYGPAVIGEVGSEQSLSFTVIGDTVNTANWLQALTRTLEAQLVVSDVLVRAAKTASSCSGELVDQLLDRGEQPLRGRDGPSGSGRSPFAPRSRTRYRLDPWTLRGRFTPSTARGAEAGLGLLLLSAMPHPAAFLPRAASIEPAAISSFRFSRDHGVEDKSCRIRRGNG
jgi:hypothetical protein